MKVAVVLRFDVPEVEKVTEILNRTFQSPEGVKRNERIRFSREAAACFRIGAGVMKFCPRCGWYYPRVDLPITMCNNPEPDDSGEARRG